METACCAKIKWFFPWVVNSLSSTFVWSATTQRLEADAAMPLSPGLSWWGPPVHLQAVRGQGTSNRTWCAVCSGLPQTQVAEGRRPQRCMLALRRPTPVRRRFSVTQSLRRRRVPGGRSSPGAMPSWVGLSVSCQSVFHCSRMLKLECLRVAACRLKGRRERRRLSPMSPAAPMRLCRRGVGALEARGGALIFYLDGGVRWSLRSGQ